MNNQRSTQDLVRDLARLTAMDRSELLKSWRDCYAHEAPPYLSQSFLMRAVAYRMQEKALGGLKASTSRYLEKVCIINTGTRRTALSHSTAKPGKRLIREWHGVTHEVTVVEGGVLYREKRYKSLSEVAGAITGAKWSGPLFFGLKMDRKAKAL